MQTMAEATRVRIKRQIEPKMKSLTFRGRIFMGGKRLFWRSIFSRHYKLNSFSVFWAAAPKGPMTYAFTHMGDFLLLLLLLHPPLWLQSPNSSPEAPIPASRLLFQPWGLNPSPKAQTPASRLQSQPEGSNPNQIAPILASSHKSQHWVFYPSLNA